MKNIESNEHIILIRRKHILILLAQISAVAFLALLPFVIYPIISTNEISVLGQPLTIDLRPALLTFLGSAWLLLFWMRAMGIWTDYYLDVWTVTDRRIIDKEQKGLFHRQTSILKLDRIQDVTVETRGMIATFFHFGDIHVQTAGEAREFVMRGISNPKKVRDVILLAQEELEKHPTPPPLYAQNEL